MTFPLLLLLAILLIGVVIAVRYLRNYRLARVGTTKEVQICNVTGDACHGGGNCHVHRSLRCATKHPTYYEDEELDRFRGTPASGYTPKEVSEWRDVLTTLQSSEVVDWVSSIHSRGLHIPEPLNALVKERLQAATAVV